MLNMHKILIRVMQLSTVFLTIALFWFAFVFYPKTLKDVEKGKFTYKNAEIKPVAATSYTLPIKTDAYSIELGKSGDYYVFINGRDLYEYENNRSSARLALKTALSLEDTCTVNVIYVSTAKLAIPDNLKSADCRL